MEHPGHRNSLWVSPLCSIALQTQRLRASWKLQAAGTWSLEKHLKGCVYSSTGLQLGQDELCVPGQLMFLPRRRAEACGFGAPGGDNLG